MTAEWIEAEQRYKLCWWYAWPDDEYEEWYYYCTYSDDPQHPDPPPPEEGVPIAGCPGTVMGETWRGNFTSVNAYECPCLDSASEMFTWEEVSAGYGPWVGTWTSCEGYTVTVKVWPGTVGGGVVLWQAFVYVNGALHTYNTAYATCGDVPTGFQFTLGEGAPCSGALMQLNLIDWPLP